MTEPGKLYHNLRSRATGLKSAADMLEQCPADKKEKIIALMRAAALEIGQLLDEVEGKK